MRGGGDLADQAQGRTIFWDPGGVNLYGTRIEGYLLSSGQRFRAEFDTDASACLISINILRELN